MPATGKFVRGLPTGLCHGTAHFLCVQLLGWFGARPSQACIVAVFW